MYRDSGNVLILDENGTPREVPVSRDGSMIPNGREFTPVPEPDEIVEEAQGIVLGLPSPYRRSCQTFISSREESDHYLGAIL